MLFVAGVSPEYLEDEERLDVREHRANRQNLKLGGLLLATSFSLFRASGLPERSVFEQPLVCDDMLLGLHLRRAALSGVRRLHA